MLRLKRRSNALWDNGAVIMVVLPERVTVIAQSLMREAIVDSIPLKPYDATHLATALWLSETGIHIDEFRHITTGSCRTMPLDSPT